MAKFAVDVTVDLEDLDRDVILAWVAHKFTPEQVFSDEDLHDWATDRGWVWEG